MNKRFIFLLVIIYSHTIFAQIGLPIQQALIPKNSLVVNYDFSKSSSYTRAGTSVNNIAGSASGSATLVQSPNFMNSLGYISFNGTNQYLVTPNLRTHFKNVNSSFQKSFTMCVWVYPTKSNGVIVSELDSQIPSGGWHATNIEIVNGIIYYRIWNGTAVTSLNTLSLNQWYHLALVYDGVKLKAYLNGALQGIQTNDRQLPTSGQYYTLAASETTHMGSGGVNGGFNCAQFKLYQLPLSDNDIQQEYYLRKDEFDYTLHSPSTNTNPTYWSTSSNFSGDVFYANAPFPTQIVGYHFTPWLNSPQGWSAGTNNSSQNIVLNYDEPAYIKGIVTQGRDNNGGQWVTSANIETSLTGGAPWTSVLSSQSLNSNSINDVSTLFSSPIYAKAVRVSPTANGWSGHITMRMGLLVKPNSTITDGLVLNLDAANIKSYQGSGSTWADLSTSNNHATISLSPTHNAATGLTFNGSTQYGRIPSVNGVTNFTNTQQYSIEIWFNPSNGQPNSSEAELLEKWNFSNESRYPFTIRFNETGRSMLVACYDGSQFPFVTASGFSVNTWAQLVAVFDFVAKTLTVYRNGVSVGSASLVGINQVSNTSPVGIAGRVPFNADGVQVPFKGTIGNIRFYNKALTASQILQNFNILKIRYGL